MAKTLSSNTFTYVKKYKSVKIQFYISLRATLKETFTAIYDCLGETKTRIYTPKRDDDYPSPFHMGVPPPPPGGKEFGWMKPS